MQRNGYVSRWCSAKTEIVAGGGRERGRTESPTDAERERERGGERRRERRKLMAHELNASGGVGKACYGTRTYNVHKSQGRLWILHHQKACCGRRCKLWSIDGRGGTVSGEVKSLFIISACAASIVSICIKMCRIFIQLSFVFLQYKIPWSISKAEVWVHTTKSKNFCLSYCKFGQQWQHKLRS